MSLILCRIGIHKFEKEIKVIDSDRYQFCKKCGKAKPVKFPKCQHIWEANKKTLDMYVGKKNKYIGSKILLQCTKCGDIKNHCISVYD